jgi:hypothetical protein
MSYINNLTILGLFITIIGLIVMNIIQKLQIFRLFYKKRPNRKLKFSPYLHVNNHSKSRNRQIYDTDIPIINI